MDLTPCSCGRFGIHCPECGATYKRILVRQTQIAEILTKQPVKAFRCNSCGCIYEALDERLFKSQECRAPLKKALKSEQRATSPDDAKAVAAAIELLQKFGAKVQLHGQDLTVNREDMSMTPAYEPPVEKKPESDSESKTVESKSKDIERELPEGWNKDSEGRPEAPEAFSLDKLIDSSKDKE